MKRHVLTMIGAVSIAGLALAGCSGDPLGGDATNAAGGDATAADCTTTTPLSVVVAPIQFEPTYIAKNQGYFAEECLDVTIVTGGSATQNIAQLVSGQVQFATVSIGALITSEAQGVPVVAVVGNAYTSDKNPTSGIVVKASSDIKTVSDLVGRTVGIQGLNTGSETAMFIAMEKAGVDPLGAERVEVPSTGMQTALDQGTVDAVLASSPQYQVLAEDTTDYRVISNPSTEFLAGVPVTPFGAMKSWLDANADTANRYIAAMKKADDYYNDPANADSILDITAEVSQQDRTKLTAASLAPVSAAIDLAKTKLQVDAYTKYGIVTTPVTVDQIIWSGAPTTN